MSRHEWKIIHHEGIGDWYTIVKKESYGEGQFISDSPNSAFWYDPAEHDPDCPLFGYDLVTDMETLREASGYRPAAEPSEVKP